MSELNEMFPLTITQAVFHMLSKHAYASRYPNTHTIFLFKLKIDNTFFRPTFSYFQNEARRAEEQKNVGHTHFLCPHHSIVITANENRSLLYLDDVSDVMCSHL